MFQSITVARTALLTSTLVLAGLVSTARADGTEQLGFNPNIAPGSAVIVAGTGLGGFGANVPGTISFDVPGGVSVEQVLLYWEGHAATELEQGATDTIVVEGIVVEGDRIGGPTRFFNMAWSSTYRADITGLGLVTNGLNDLDVSGTDFGTANNGAGVLVVVDDGVNTTDIAVADGDDNAFIGFPPPLDTTTPVTYAFAAAAVDRVAPLAMFFGSAAAKRPSIIQILVDGMLSESLVDELNDGEGPEFDIVRHDVHVPAGATSVTVQCLSADSGIGPYAGKLPVSLTWIASAFVLQGVPPDDGGGEGCTPGYWKQKQHFDSYPAGILPSDLFSKYFEDAFPGKTLVQVLGNGGGGLSALGRHTVAAFLNAHSDGVDYDLTPAQIVDAFNDVYPGTKAEYNQVKNVFEGFNEQGCPLN